ncbi:hypothetical protein Sgly_0281 [Syntrophobotulus glycolicus DSM 8271]|uniref:Uncharacterized protein n=1 Tax=Syntrophobotulus glycolicus (strain DSM 8271 / FlGlyR) TaxID=645991 RepID=F0SWW0_SYNGF|nr:hypothetical protein Sgly_0281 [Syntrophobotulus glycolicus DSM 8271]
MVVERRLIVLKKQATTWIIDHSGEGGDKSAL